MKRFSFCSLIILGVLFMLLNENVLVSGTPEWAGYASWCRTELFFGLSKPKGGYVTPEEFETFVAETVAVSFPDGFTVFNSSGYWMGSTGSVHEDSRLILILHNCTDESLAAARRISDLYAKTFDQDAVLYTVQKDTTVCTESGCFSTEKWSSIAIGFVVLSIVCGFLVMAVIIAFVAMKLLSNRHGWKQISQEG